MIQIAIIEDDSNFLEEITAAINRQQNLRCSLSRSSIAEFYQSLDLDRIPDLLLLDQDIDGINAVEHLEKLFKLMPQTSIIMMASEEKACLVLKSLKLGIRAYFNKVEGAEQLIYAIRQVIKGNAYLSPKSTSIALDFIHKSNKCSAEEQLSDKIATRLTWNATQREIDVIRGLIDGHSYKEIASSNYMTIDGVRYYVRSIYPKLGVSSRDQLVKIITR